jgi:hypothetical protein
LQSQAPQAAIAEKVDLPACPHIAKRPRRVKQAQSHFLISALQKQNPMALQPTNNVLERHKNLWVENSFDAQAKGVLRWLSEVTSTGALESKKRYRNPLLYRQSHVLWAWMLY